MEAQLQVLYVQKWNNQNEPLLSLSYSLWTILIDMYFFFKICIKAILFSPLFQYLVVKVYKYE